MAIEFIGLYALQALCGVAHMDTLTPINTTFSIKEDVNSAIVQKYRCNELVPFEYEYEEDAVHVLDKAQGKDKKIWYKIELNKDSYAWVESQDDKKLAYTPIENWLGSHEGVLTHKMRGKRKVAGKEDVEIQITPANFAGLFYAKKVDGVPGHNKIEIHSEPKESSTWLQTVYDSNLNSWILALEKNSADQTIIPVAKIENNWAQVFLVDPKKYPDAKYFSESFKRQGPEKDGTIRGWIPLNAVSRLEPSPDETQEAAAQLVYKGKMPLTESDFDSIKILETKYVGGKLWLHIQKMFGECKVAAPIEVDGGWIPAFDEHHELSVMVFTRGC